MAGELSRGTLTHLLTKGLSRKDCHPLEICGSGLLWTASYLLCFAVTYATPSYFWPARRGKAPAPRLACGVRVLMLSALLLGGLCCYKTITAASVVGALVAALLPCKHRTVS